MKTTLCILLIGVGLLVFVAGAVGLAFVFDHPTGAVRDILFACLCVGAMAAGWLACFAPLVHLLQEGGR